MYTIARYTYLIDAQLAQLKLARHGIESHIADEYMVTMQWLYANAIGGIRLQVTSQDLEEAWDVLHTNEDISIDTPRCPKCDSTETFRMRMSFWSFPLYLIGAFFPIPSKKLICAKCGEYVPPSNKTPFN